MLVLKSLDIDLTKSEARTLLGFSLLYSFLVLVIIGGISFTYYKFQKDLMLQEKRHILQEYSNDFIFKLKDLHVNFDKYKYYPRDEKFNSAIFDSDKKLIFSTLESKDVKFDKVTYISENMIHFIEEPESYYLGTKYIILEIPDDNVWFRSVKGEIITYSFIAFIFMLILGYFISKLFLKPMRDALHLLDRFIKDTTHELNTPISAIITNIEMIDKDILDAKLAKKINRIDIGAKTISNIYEDLTFLTLNNKIISQNENLNLSNVLEQRVEYFKSLATIKKINFVLNIEKDIYLNSDLKKISKLIDNLISNAIKYNKIAGTIKVTLKENFLSIEDTGKGMSKENLSNLFERYSRFDKSVGGFGIGLNIVSLIAKEYNLDIKVESELNKGTKIEVIWQN
ncbi:sensor histidine kinase [Poseidonibacter ostreae]|uniref:histidine kinase n=3 Tax=Poseidonibacter ostreae TaxID=2654171 RepID=A0A6L4WPC5_9BACT|nr:HAMP domain-containing sensor histidine kinase [Poseidonibacter ostreae]KAB7885800.1 sensor histidine kinase [Poseidonibacter ostreae]KAB7886963.1 sensor histidine kinase [Poseidonibacter ostreae]